MSPDPAGFVSTLEQICNDVVRPDAATVDRQGAFPERAVKALAAAGLMGTVSAPEVGGLGLGFRGGATVVGRLAQECGSTAMVVCMHYSGTAVLEAFGSREIRQAAASGEHLSTLAFSEAGSRSHFWAPVSKAADENGRIRIKAKKSFVTSAGQADGYVVSTGDAKGAQPLESTIYLTLSSDAGVAANGSWSGVGMRGNSSAPMTFDVLVDADRALTEPGKGLYMMLGIVLPLFQVGSAAIGVGIAEASVRATQAHLTSSRLEHQNKTLAELPTLRARLAEMRVETDKSRAHLAAVLDSLESPGPMTQLLVLEAKGAATEAAVRVTDLAMRTCGGAAFGGAYGLERRFRDARAPIIMSPTTDQAYDIIGRALCGLELLA